MHKKPLYLDLFDDEFYDISCFDKLETTHEKELNAIRLHLLLWFALGRTAIIPEQWVISSATTSIIISEILPSFYDYIQGTKQSNLPPPIIFSSFKRGETRQSEMLRAAFIERLQKARIKLSPTFNQGEINQSAIRQGLINFFRDGSYDLHIGDENKRRNSSLDIALESLADALTSSTITQGERNENRCTYERIANILLYNKIIMDSGKFVTSSALTESNLYTYGTNIEEEITIIKHTSNNEKYKHCTDDRIKSLRGMFSKAEQDDIPLTQIMTLHDKYLPDLPNQQKSFILRLGQRCMHKAISNQFGADFATNGMSADFGVGLDPFERDFHNSVRDQQLSSVSKLQRRQIDPISVVCDNYSTLGRSTIESYDFANQLEWSNNIWPNVWKFLYDPIYEKRRSKIKYLYNNISNNKDLDKFDEWNYYIDEITSQLHYIKIGENFGKYFIPKEIEKKIQKDPLNYSLDAGLTFGGLAAGHIHPIFGIFFK